MADGIVGAITGLFRGRGSKDELARVDAEITAFGETLARHSFTPSDHRDDPGLLADYQRALDAYEQAKQSLVGDRSLEDATDVLRALDEGRHALACVDALVAGRPRPQRHPTCFFDPRHGQATEEVRWAPAGGTARTIAVCAADAVRLADGMPPIRTRPREQRPDPPPGSTAAGTERRTEHRPAPSPPSPPASTDPYGAWPERTGARQRWESRGTTGVQLSRTSPRTPALLVVHLERSEDSWVELTSPPGSDGRPRQILTHGSPLRRAIVPVEADGRDAIRLQMHTGGKWRVWLHPPEEIPLWQGELETTGSYVLRHPGGRTPLRITQHEGAAFSLHVLRPDFRIGAPLHLGHGPFTASVTAPRRAGLLYVRSRGSWAVATPGGVRGGAAGSEA